VDAQTSDQPVTRVRLLHTRTHFTDTQKEAISTEESKAIVRRFAEEIWNEKRLDRADEIMTQDYVDHGAMPGQAPGLEGFKQKGAMSVAAVPDLVVRTEDLFAEIPRRSCFLDTRHPMLRRLLVALRAAR